MVQELESYWIHERDWDSYEELVDEFEFQIPNEFNVAEYVCDRWVEGNSRVAVHAEDADGNTETYTFWQLKQEANKLANYLSELGVGAGDRVAVTAGQRPQTLVTHLAAWKVGGASVQLSSLFGPQGLEYRLRDAEVTAAVVDHVSIEAYRDMDGDLPDLEQTLVTEKVAPTGSERRLSEALQDQAAAYETVATDPADTFSILFTSGTTGDPKGTLLPHKFVLGGLPSFLCSHVNLGEAGVCWMPVEWSWSGFYLPMLTNLFLGKPIVAHDREEFDPEQAFEIIEKYGVNYGVIPPSALRMMMQVEDPDRFDVSNYRSLVIGGEEIGENVYQWVKDVFDGAAINSAFGQSECLMPIGECHALGIHHKEGKMGRAYPGHDVEILDPDRAEATVPSGEVGEIGVRYEADPMCFSGYLGLPEKTEEKIKKGWLRTEDLGVKHEDGYFSFESRKDDVIISSGYRIGPGEIEDTLLGHEAVADVGVIGVPHDERGEIVKAFVNLANGYQPDGDRKEALQDYVKHELAKYEYPRRLEFVDELPKTNTGKLQRSELREWEGIE
jgi:acetyl-CoA synthetase